MADYIDWPGKSGNVYRYWFIADPSTTGLKSDAGNYMFVKQLPNRNWLPIYIGQADTLNQRIPNHDRWGDAKRAGATHVMAHTTPAGESARLAEEKDLIQHWQPQLNTHHKQVS